MAKPKNKKTKKVKKRGVVARTSKPVVSKSRIAKRKKFDQKSFAFAKKIIVAVILLAMMMVVLAALTTFFKKPESVVENKIEDIAEDYYENYYYDKMMSYAPAGKSLEEIMGRYVERGFSEVTLRQLTLFDSRKHANAESVLFEYCDPDATYIKIYPEAPFGKNDYRVEYKYACMF